MREFRGGIRIGNSYCDAMNYSYPFAEAIFTEKSLRLSTGFLFLKKRYLLPYHDILGVSLKKGIVCQGILIRHRLNDLPEFILFWTGRYQCFLEECKKHSISIH